MLERAFYLSFCKWNFFFLFWSFEQSVLQDCIHNKHFSFIKAYITDYTELGGNEELPLGEEFQSLVKVFIDNKEKKAERKYELFAVLIEQLE